jgi:hypothetical protein
LGGSARDVTRCTDDLFQTANGVDCAELHETMAMHMKEINEDEPEPLIEEHLRERGWDITDFAVTRKRWRDHLDGEEADRVFLDEGKVITILEAKKPGKDLWAAVEQAKGYARAYKRNTGGNVPLLFASDGAIYLFSNGGAILLGFTATPPVACGKRRIHQRGVFWKW